MFTKTRERAAAANSENLQLSRRRRYSDTVDLEDLEQAATAHVQDQSIYVSLYM